MRFVGTTLLLALASIAGSSLVLAFGGPRAALSDRLTADFETVRSRAHRASVERRAKACGRVVALGRHFNNSRVSTAAAAVCGRGLLSAPALSLFLAALAVGTMAGLLRRHLLRDECGFASLTWSYAGKCLVSVSLAAFAHTALAPVAPPLWFLYVCCAGAAGGAALYFGNLPPKL